MILSYQPLEPFFSLLFQCHSNIDELILIADGSFDDEYQAQIIHLPLTQFTG